MQQNNKPNLTPTAINRYLKTIFDNDIHLKNLSVIGEISNFKTSGGNFYFSIKDAQAQINCVMFKNNNEHLSFIPKDGEEVICQGSIYYREKTGTYSLNVRSLEQSGIGLLEQKFKELKNKLHKQGYFDQKYKQVIKPGYEKVAVLTAPTSAAVKDIITTIKRRNPLMEIIIVPTIVQGEKAAASIAQGIELVNKLKLAPVMIVGRGGGSIEDLWAFNEEIVAEAVFNSEIPIISCVGHETDTTIIDYVADLRAPTPTSAAEQISIDLAGRELQLKNMNKFIAASVREKLMTAKLKLGNIVTTAEFANPLINKELALDHLRSELSGELLKYQKNIDVYQVRKDSLVRELRRTMTDHLSAKKHELINKDTELDLLNPLTILKRGYSVCYDQTGQVVKEVSQKNLGEQVEVQLRANRFVAEILEVKE